MANIKGLNSDTFSFSDSFQKNIITAMVTKPKLYERVGIFVNENAFEIKDYRLIFKTIKDFFSEYKSIPSKDTLYEAVKSKNISDTPNLQNTIEEIYNNKLINTDYEYIEKEVKDFVSYQAIKNAIINSIDDINDKTKHFKIKHRIEEALLVTASMEDMGIDVYSDSAIISRWNNRQDNNEIKVYKTGWSQIDEILGGGLESKTITSIFGVSNSGKSMYLVNVGANFLLQGYNVLHISLEMSEESVVKRYDSRLLGLTQNELKFNSKSGNKSKSVEKLKELLNHRIGRLFVKEFMANKITADDINAYIERLENVNGLKIDFIVVDYADIMRSSSKYNDRRFELESIYIDLRNIAKERDIPILTATQLNRSGLEASKNGEIMDAQYIAESYGIFRHLDTGLFLTATPADIANHTSIIYVGKSRSGSVGQQIRFYVDYNKCLIKEWSAVDTTDIETNNNTSENTEIKSKNIFNI